MDARMQRQKRVRQDWGGEELGSQASGSSFSGDGVADAYSSDDDSGRGRLAVRWTGALEARFLKALEQAGGVWEAKPKAILMKMGAYASQLTTIQVKSHLQKHRIKVAAEMQRQGIALATPTNGEAPPPLQAARMAAQQQRAAAEAAQRQATAAAAAAAAEQQRAAKVSRGGVSPSKPRKSRSLQQQQQQQQAAQQPRKRHSSLHLQLAAGSPGPHTPQQPGRYEQLGQPGSTHFPQPGLHHTHYPQHFQSAGPAYGGNSHPYGHSHQSEHEQSTMVTVTDGTAFPPADSPHAATLSHASSSGGPGAAASGWEVGMVPSRSGAAAAAAAAAAHHGPFSMVQSRGPVGHPHHSHNQPHYSHYPTAAQHGGGGYGGHPALQARHAPYARLSTHGGSQHDEVMLAPQPSAPAAVWRRLAPDASGSSWPDLDKLAVHSSGPAALGGHNSHSLPILAHGGHSRGQLAPLAHSYSHAGMALVQHDRSVHGMAMPDAVQHGPQPPSPGTLLDLGAPHASSPLLGPVVVLPGSRVAAPTTSESESDHFIAELLDMPAMPGEGLGGGLPKVAGADPFAAFALFDSGLF